MVKAFRLVLAPGAARQLQVELEGDRPAACDVAKSRDRPVLVVATSLAGQPGVLLVDRTAPAAPRAAGAGMAVGPHPAAPLALAAPRPPAGAVAAAPAGAPRPRDLPR